jgi:UDP-glucose:(heptosyl)LPS alpha-1,3-glucosyltransferase
MKIAVCYEVVDPRLGGAETYVADLCRGLSAAGHTVDLLADRWVDAALPPGVGRIRIAADGFTRLGRIWNFARGCESYLRRAPAAYDVSIGFLNTWGQDVLIPQGGVRAASLDGNAVRFASAPLRSAYRLGKRLNLRWWVYQAIERRQYDPARGSHFIAVSQMVRDHMARYHRLTADRVTVIPNAIDERRLALPDPTAARREFRTRLGCRDEDAVGLFIAHNYKLKGLGPLIHSLAQAQVRAGGAVIRLAVCGAGKPGPYQALARRLGVSERVHFLGFLPDVRIGYQGCDFLVLPSYYDPCSLVVLEALACGRPVITSRQNGAGELICSGEQGFVIERPDAVDSLAAALVQIGHPDRRRLMSEAARWLGSQLSFEGHLRRLVEVLERVAASRQTRSLRGPHATEIATRRSAPPVAGRFVREDQT